MVDGNGRQCAVVAATMAHENKILKYILIFSVLFRMCVCERECGKDV